MTSGSAPPSKDPLISQCIYCGKQHLDLKQWQQCEAYTKRLEDLVTSTQNNPPPAQNPGLAQSSKKGSKKSKEKGKKKSAPFPFPTDLSFLNFVVRFIILELCCPIAHSWTLLSILAREETKLKKGQFRCIYCGRVHSDQKKWEQCEAKHKPLHCNICLGTVDRRDFMEHMRRNHPEVPRSPRTSAPAGSSTASASSGKKAKKRTRPAGSPQRSEELPPRPKSAKSKSRNISHFSIGRFPIECLSFLNMPDSWIISLNPYMPDCWIVLFSWCSFVAALQHWW